MASNGITKEMRKILRQFSSDCADVLPMGFRIDGIAARWCAVGVRVTNMSKTVTVDARKYQDDDDCLSAAERDAQVQYGLEGWDLEPRWEDDQRERIILTLPDYMD